SACNVPEGTGNEPVRISPRAAAGDDVAVPWDIRVAPGERGAGIVPAPVRAAGDWACDHRLRWLAHDRDAERQRASLASTRRRAAHGAPSTSSPTRVAGRGVAALQDGTLVDLLDGQAI